MISTVTNGKLSNLEAIKMWQEETDRNLIKKLIITNIIIKQNIKVRRSMRKQFKLMKPQFSDDSDTQKQINPNTSIMEMYNSDYSLLVNQAKIFFNECKKYLSKFITPTSISIGFNYQTILNFIVKTQQSVINHRTNPKKKNIPNEEKQNFQKCFCDIITKMGDVIKELRDLQINMKKDYLGQAFQPMTQKNKASLRLPNKKLILNQFKQIIEKNENPQKQQQIRSILKKKIKETPQPLQSQQLVCHPDNSSSSNLDHLSNKIQSLTNQIRFSMTKQQKIWKIFNEKRPSKNITGSDTKNIMQKQQCKEDNNLIKKTMKTIFTSTFSTNESAAVAKAKQQKILKT